MADPIPVLIEYERQVVSTSEGATLSAMLMDLARLLETGPPGEVFRRVYGSATEKSVEDLRRAVRRYDGVLFGGSLLVSPSPDAPSGVTQSRVVTPEDVEVNLERLQIRRRDGSAFEASDFNPNADISSEARGAFEQAYGQPMLFISEADLGEIERIAELAEGIGVDLNRVDVASLPSFTSGRERDIVRFRVVATYFANLRQKLTEFATGGDFLMQNGQRPGGHNFSAQHTSDERLRHFEDRVARLRDLAATDPRLRPSTKVLRQLEMERSSVAGQRAIAEYVYVPEWAQHRPDTYATLRVIRGGGPRSQDPFGSSAGFEVLFQTNRFLLESANESDMERAAFVETFGPTYLYLFGTRSRVWNYSGVLFDTEGLTWLNEWRQAYESYTGGTTTAKLRARVFLTYDNVVREGIIIGTNVGKSVGQFGWARFSFQMFVIRTHYLDGNALNELPVDLETFLTPKDPVKVREEQYSITMSDVTAQRRETSPVNPSADAKRAQRIEDSLFQARKADVENLIRRDAFPDGRLARTSGSVLTDVTDSEVRRASQSFVDGVATLTQFEVSDVRVVQKATSRDQLAVSGSVR